MGSDSTVLQPVPESIIVLIGINNRVVVVGVTGLELEELGDELVGGGDGALLFGALLELLDGGGSYSRNFRQVTSDFVLNELFHTTGGDLGTLGIKSFGL